MSALEVGSWRAVVVFRLIASLRRKCFGQKNQMSKGVDQVLEFKQYFLACFMRNLASNTPKVCVKGPMSTQERNYFEGPTSLQELQLVVVC